jgi:hypothetical protein
MNGESGEASKNAVVAAARSQSSTRILKLVCSQLGDNSPFPSVSSLNKTLKDPFNTVVAEFQKNRRHHVRDPARAKLLKRERERERERERDKQLRSRSS